jgi:hypothetical protein
MEDLVQQSNNKIVNNTYAYDARYVIGNCLQNYMGAIPAPSHQKLLES